MRKNGDGSQKPTKLDGARFVLCLTALASGPLLAPLLLPPLVGTLNLFTIRIFDNDQLFKRYNSSVSRLILREMISPVPLSAINRRRSGNSSGWIGTMNSVPRGQSRQPSVMLLLLMIAPRGICCVFPPSGCMTHYALKGKSGAVMMGFDFDSGSETEGKLAVEPIKMWSMIQNQSRREAQDQHSDIWRLLENRVLRNLGCN